MPDLFRFYHRLTLGETPEPAVADVEKLQAVAAARAAKLRMEVSAPVYTLSLQEGYVLNNPPIYTG